MIEQCRQIHLRLAEVQNLLRKILCSVPEASDRGSVLGVGVVVSHPGIFDVFEVPVDEAGY